MKQQIKRQYRILKTTAIGGLLFLLPLVVIGAAVGYVWNIVMMVYSVLKDVIPFDDAATLALLFVIAVLIVLLLCFLCGVLARRALARRFSKTLEKQLMTVFPKYGIYKDLLAGNIGGEEHAPSMKPICVQFSEFSRPAFETGRLEDGRVAVYLPGAPDAWIGSVALVEADRVEPLDIPLPEFIGIFEQMGRECATLTGLDSARE